MFDESGKQRFVAGWRIYHLPFGTDSAHPNTYWDPQSLQWIELAPSLLTDRGLTALNAEQSTRISGEDAYTTLMGQWGGHRQLDPNRQLVFNPRTNNWLDRESSVPTPSTPPPQVTVDVHVDVDVDRDE